MDRKSATKHARRYNSVTTSFNINQVYPSNPWVVAWWSAAFPGFGHLNLGIYIKGFILVLWEIWINAHAEINSAMVYSFTGRFEAAKEVLNPRWVLLYIPVYIYAIWDSYHRAISLNKHYVLAESENETVTIFKMDSVTLTLLDKRSPMLSLVWSLFFPGLGHFYLKRIPNGILIVVCGVLVAYCSHLIEAVLYLIVGSLEQAKAVLIPGWFSYFPSIYCFAAYEAYVIAVEQNKLCEKEQFQFHRSNTQPWNFKLLGPNGSEGP